MLTGQILLLLITTHLTTFTCAVVLTSSAGREWTPLPIPLHQGVYLSSKSSSSSSSRSASSSSSLSPLNKHHQQNHSKNLPKPILSSSPSSSASSPPLLSSSSSSTSHSNFTASLAAKNGPKSAALKIASLVSSSAPASTIHTKDHTYTVESRHFSTPIIEHHENGATVGLDLPDSNIRLLLDIDELGGRPVAQHIGLKVVERGDHKKSESSSNGIKILKLTNSNHKNENAKSSPPTLVNRVYFNHIADQSNSIETHSPIAHNNNNNGHQQSYSNLIQIPVSSNYKIGYVRTIDLHSAIKHGLLNAKPGTRNALISSSKYTGHAETFVPVRKGYNGKGYAINSVATLGVGLKSPAAALQSVRNGRAQVTSKPFLSPADGSNSFKPIEKYSAKLEGKTRTMINLTDNYHNNSNDVDKRFSGKTVFGEKISTTSSGAPQSPVKTIRDKNVDKFVFIDNSVKSDNGVNNDEGSVKWSAKSRTGKSSALRISSSGKLANSPASLPVNSDNNNNQNANTLPTGLGDNSDVGFDDDPTVNTNNGEMNGDDDVIPTEAPFDDSRLTRLTDRSNFGSSFSSSSSSSSSPSSSSSSMDDVCFNRCAIPCETNTEQFLNSDKSSLQSIAKALDADLLLNLIPNAQENLQSMMDFASSGYTLFLPSNEAIKKMPKNLLSRWNSNISELTELLENHFIDSPQMLDDLDFSASISPRATDSILKIIKFKNSTYTINGKNVIVGK